MDHVIYKSDKTFQMIAHIVLAVFSLLCIFPFILMLISSFTDESSIIKTGYTIFPKAFSLSAYQYIIREWEQIFRAYGITVFVTVIGTVFGVAMTTMLGYILSRKDLPGRKIINFFVLFTMLYNGGLVPTYLLYTNTFHIKNTIFALIIPSLMTNAFYILITRTYISGNIPESMLEASRIDGAGEFRIFIVIVVPLSKAIIATITIFIGLGYWNDWLNGMYYLTDAKLFSIQTLLNKMLNNVNFLARNSAIAAQAGSAVLKLPSITIRMAIAIVGILPIMIIYPFMQKYFVRGITLSVIKG